MAVWSTGIGTCPFIKNFMAQIGQASRRSLANDEWLRVEGCNVYAPPAKSHAKLYSCLFNNILGVKHHCHFCHHSDHLLWSEIFMHSLYVILGKNLVIFESNALFLYYW